MTRDDTHGQILRAALELFAEQGYDKTSLREIAERLGVTKAALYYHFRAKEGILTALVQEGCGPLREVIEWARAAPPGLTTRQQALRRYEAALTEVAPLFRLLQANWAAVRGLAVGTEFQNTMADVVGLVRDPTACLPDQLRCSAAVLTLHAAVLALDDLDAEPAEKRAAALEVALDLLTPARPPD
jgi:AcrR family transcriptional regulator